MRWETSLAKGRGMVWLRRGVAVVALFGAMACSKSKQSEDEWIQTAARRAQPVVTPEPSPTPSAMAMAAVEIRGRLADFYLRMFPSLIQSPYFQNMPSLNQADYFTQRLLMPEKDPTREEAERWLGLHVIIDSHKQRRGITRVPVRVAYFPDVIQRHRDEIASVVVDMDIPKLGEAERKDLVEGAKLDFGRWTWSRRVDLPWSMVLLAKTIPPATPFQNADGTTITLTQIAKSMAEGEAPPEAREPFSCYDYHTLYAMVSATASGRKNFIPATRGLLEQALEEVKGLNDPGRPNFASLDELLARVKINGHLLEAYFRGSEDDFPLHEFRGRVEPVLTRLLEDSRILTKDGVKYEGSPEIFLAVPHAVHAMDLAIPRLGGSLEGMPTFKLQDRKLSPNEAIERAKARQAAQGAQKGAAPPPQ